MIMNRRQFTCAVACLPLLASPVHAESACIFNTAGIAINGIDPVGYFSDQRPIDGSDQYRLRWRNVIWRFASLETMDAFERDPYYFAPRYGGFCSVSMASGAVSDTVPKAWSIRDGRLYLAETEPAMMAWKQEPSTYIDRADHYWPSALCG
jgi:hypothetical protein